MQEPQPPDGDPRSRFVVREGGRQDLSAMADNLESGFASYRTWSHPGWEPPTRAEMLLGMMQRFSLDGSWTYLGLIDHVPAGHVTARPELDERGTPVSGSTRLTHLFLRRGHWGSGLATLLHDTMLASMRERGYRNAVLWTPAGAARARAFYAKLGWQPTGALDPDNTLGLELVEYALELPTG